LRGVLEGMEYDFVVKPGGDVEDIILGYKGTDGIEVEDGKLKIKTTLGEMREEIPAVYQIREGERVAIEAAYVLQGNEVSIKVEDYDRSNDLIIDPWITYYGGSGADEGVGITVDGSGNVLTMGWTVSTDFPFTPGAFQISLSGVSWDVFVVKMCAGGNRLWATYYGGTGIDYGYGIATDGSSNVVITGKTASIDFPVTSGVFMGGAYDAFAVKLDPAGNQLWATYYGGSDEDYGNGIATDGNSNVLITGRTYSTNFPVTLGAFQMIFAGGSYDAFVMKLDGATGDTLWSTYYGGSSFDQGTGIATDGSDNVLITGWTGSANFPVTSSAFQTSLGSAPFNDVFVVKLDGATGDTLWATYYGGSNIDQGNGIATDGSDNVLISGITRSTDFPVTSGAFQTINIGVVWDAFVVKLDATGDTLWATYLQGSDREEGMGIAVDGSDNIYVTGDTYSTDFPFTPGVFQTVKNGPAGSPNEENYVVKFDRNGNQVCGTYIGGSGHDEMYSGGNIAVFGGLVYITGYTPGSYPVTAGAFQPVFGGGPYGAFIASLCDDCTMNCSPSLTVNASAFPDTICKDDCINLSSIVAGDSCKIYTFSWTSIPSGFTSAAQDTVACPDTTTTYIVTVDDGSTTATDSVTIVVLQVSIVDLGADTAICAGDSVTLDAGNPGVSYSWSTGDTTQAIIITTIGTYWVVVDSGGCIGLDTIIIDSGLIVALRLDTTICDGDSIILDAENSGASYSWSTGDSTQTITADTAGTYWVTVDDGGCIGVDTIVLGIDTIPAVDLGADTTICSGDSIMLNAGNPGAGYNWYTGESSQTITVNSAGIYWVEVDNSGCIKLDTINIGVEDCSENTFFIPNSFSPNGDNINDVLFVRGRGIKNIKLFIYNRWGEKVFETYNINNGWDGTYKKKTLNTAIFSWYAEVEFNDGDNPGQIFQKGNVTLIK